MKRPMWIIFILLLALSCGRQSPQYQTVRGYAQGGSYTIKYSSIREDGSPLPYSVDDIHDLADSVLREIDNTLSGYNPHSLLSQINANQTTQTNEMFRELFRRSEEIYQETDGLFDVSGGPLFDVWGFGFKEKKEISQQQVDSILNFIGMDKIHLTPEGNILKEDARVQLNFNAIAQGYSCDVIAQVLEERGIQHYLIEVGMEILCKGLNPAGQKWRIGIDSPIDGNNVAGASIQETVEVTDCGIVTSGNYRKYYIRDGKKYSHTIHPKTGRPVSHHLLSATIIAPDATAADAYATYCMVLGLEEAQKFITSRPDLEGVLIYEKDGSLETWISDGIHKI